MTPNAYLPEKMKTEKEMGEGGRVCGKETTVTPCPKTMHCYYVFDTKRT